MAISGPVQHRSTTAVRRTSTRTPARLAGLALAGLLGLGAAGCGAQDDPADPADPAGTDAAAAPQEQVEQGDGPRLVQGGEPGEAAREVPSDTKAPANQWSPDDATFMSMMIPHHAQALEMTALVADRAKDPRVVRLAERISASQAPEIQMMAAWLDQRDLEVPTAADADHTEHGDHGAHAMEGMLTDEQMEQLADARGASFDRLFLTSMIRHHEGALDMADETAGGGLDIIVNEHRDGITSDQSTEVARMRQLLDSL